MRAIDAIQLSNASQSSKVTGLEGGLYQLSAVATWNSGSVKVEQQALDGSTMIDTGTGLTANGVATVYLAPGNYQLVVASATAVYAALTRVPTE